MVPQEYYTVWYPLIEFPESPYEINKMGQVRNKKTGKILKPCIKYGYLAYTLYINSKMYYRHAHILVARQFIPNPEGKPIVNHIDENKRNPCVDNLEWVTNKENSLYGTSSRRNGQSKEKAINEYSLTGQYIRTWRSSTALAEYFSSRGKGDKEQLKANILRCVNANRSNHRKRIFAKRLFFIDNGKHDDIQIDELSVSPRKYKNLSLEYITKVPEEYLLVDESYKNSVEILKGIQELSSLDNTQVRAIDYAIQSIERLNQISSIINKR